MNINELFYKLKLADKEVVDVKMIKTNIPSIVRTRNIYKYYYNYNRIFNVIIMFCWIFNSIILFEYDNLLSYELILCTVTVFAMIMKMEQMQKKIDKNER